MGDQSPEHAEQVVIETREHWLSAGLWWRWLVAILLLVVTLVTFFLYRRHQFPAVGGLGLIALTILWLLFGLLVPYARWRSRVYRLTDRRLVIEEGIVTRRSTSLPLNRLQDISTEVGPLGRVLGYGTIRLENAGESSGFDRLVDIPNPERFRDLVLEHIGIARQSGM